MEYGNQKGKFISEEKIFDLILFLFFLRKKLESLNGSKQWTSNERDPFLVCCEFRGSCVTAVELAFQINKPERALLIIDVTKGQLAIEVFILSPSICCTTMLQYLKL